MINWMDHIASLIKIQDECLNFDVNKRNLAVAKWRNALLEIGHVEKCFDKIILISSEHIANYR